MDDPRVWMLYLSCHRDADVSTFQQWTDILPKVPLGPSSRHLFKIPETGDFNFVKLNMYPDGGIVSIYLMDRPR
jgi:allantoicase